ncbi:MAG: hypothetical protein MUC50_17795 [Myxococcota bacterium]|nr:hypothetical protein [Myxococcota bacterium]
MKRLIGMALVALLAFGCSQVDELEGDAAEMGELDGEPGDEADMQARTTHHLPPDIDVAELGQGRNSVTEEWRGQCLTSVEPIVSYGNPIAGLTLTRITDTSQLEETFDLSGSAKATYGLFTANTRHNFSKMVKSDSRSVNMVFKASADTRTLILNEAKSTLAYNKESPISFYTQCGDEAVTQIKQGGEIYLIIRIDFASVRDKTAYEGAVKATYGAQEAVLELKKVRQSFSDRSTVYVNAFQIGGEVTYLYQTVDAQSGARCSLAEFEQCETFITSALEYVSGYRTIPGPTPGTTTKVELPNAFPFNLERKPGNLLYTTRDWASLGIAVDNPNVSAAVTSARDSLHRKTKLQLAVQNRVTAIMEADFFAGPESFEDEVERLGTASKENVRILQRAILACYDNLASPNGEAACLDAAKDSTLQQRGYVNLDGYESLLDTPITTYNFSDGTNTRNDYVQPIHPGNGYWGSWSSWKICPTGQYVIGYKMRVEDPCDNDDTGLNAVELTCGTWKRYQTSLIQPHPGVWGYWKSEARCEKGPINGMRIDIEPPRGSGDDTAANNIIASCVNGQEIQAPGGTPWGQPGTMTYCEAGTAVCGVRVRFEGRQGSDDDTAMNGLSLLCCAY